MLYIFLAALSSSALSFIFKFFPRYHVDTFQAIVFNYFSCVLTAWVVGGSFPITKELLLSDAAQYAFVIGTMFILTFQVVGLCVQWLGMATAAILQKMSMLATVIVAIIFYQDPITTFKILGIGLAIFAIFLMNKPKSSEKEQEKKDENPRNRLLTLIAAITFFASAACDLGVFLIAKIGNSSAGNPELAPVIFLTAGTLGLLFLIIQIARGQKKWDRNSIFAGIILGIPNYFSLYFMMLAIAYIGEGSRAMPLINVTVIIISTLTAFLFFKEKLDKYQWLGIAGAIGAILLIAY